MLTASSKLRFRMSAALQYILLLCVAFLFFGDVHSSMAEDAITPEPTAIVYRDAEDFITEWYGDNDVFSSGKGIAIRIELNGQTAASVESENSYSYEIADGIITVTYASGLIEQLYLLPPAITEERMASFTSLVSSATRKRMVYVYWKMDHDKALDRMDGQVLLATYPSLKEQTLYIFRGYDPYGLDPLRAEYPTPNRCKQVAAFFAQAGYTLEDYALDMQLVNGGEERLSPALKEIISIELNGNK